MYNCTINLTRTHALGMSRLWFHNITNNSIDPMERILDGNSEIGADVMSDLSYLICSRLSFRSSAVKNLIFPVQSVCALFSELPSYISTVINSKGMRPGIYLPVYLFMRCTINLTRTHALGMSILRFRNITNNNRPHGTYI